MISKIGEIRNLTIKYINGQEPKEKTIKDIEYSRKYFYIFLNEWARPKGKDINNEDFSLLSDCIDLEEAELIDLMGKYRNNTTMSRAIKKHSISKGYLLPDLPTKEEISIGYELILDKINLAIENNLERNLIVDNLLFDEFIKKTLGDKTNIIL